jgi:Protein of unknown function (DUF664)
MVRSRVELFERIRRDSRVEHLSIRELADRHGVHRRTVRQALGSAVPPPRKVWLHADATIHDLPADAPARVPWWPQPEVTLHTMLVHVLAETNRHAGHADILREQLEGAAGMRSDNSNVAEHDPAWWDELRGRIEAAAQAARS